MSRLLLWLKVFEFLKVSSADKYKNNAFCDAGMELYPSAHCNLVVYHICMSMGNLKMAVIFQDGSQMYDF